MLPDRYPLDIKFANKQTNSSGLQIADLVAHPIARHIVKRNQPNKAFDIVKEKLLGYPEYEEIGLKCHVFGPTGQSIFQRPLGLQVGKTSQWCRGKEYH